MKAGRRVYRSTLAELIETLGRAEREGRLIEKIRFLGRSSLLIVDEIGYLPITPGGANLFFQLINARYEKGAMILTSNRGFAEWGDVFGDRTLTFWRRTNPRTNPPDDERTHGSGSKTREIDERTEDPANEPEPTSCRRRGLMRLIFQSFDRDLWRLYEQRLAHLSVTGAHHRPDSRTNPSTA